MEKSTEKTLTRRKFMLSAAGTALGITLPGCITTKKPQTPSRFSFGIVADVQYADYPHRGSRYYQQSRLKLKQCVQDFNSENLSFVIQLGDFIDGGFDNIDTMLDIYQKLQVPKYHVLGNHDFAASQTEIMDKLGLAKSYYDFVVEGWRFIVLDGNDISLYANQKGSEKYKQAQDILLQLKKTGESNAATYNGTLSTEQISWLKDRLKIATNANQQVIIFCHFPVYPPNAHNLWDDVELVELIESYDCVTAYINGHNHAGNYAEKNGIHYLTLHGMVETPDKTAYAVVQVNDQQLKIIGSGREPTRTLPIRKQ